MLTDDQIANCIALSLQPLMAALEAKYDHDIGRGQHNIILLVGGGNSVQFVANCERIKSIKLLQALLARWSLGLPDTMPGEVTKADTRAFEYLLNEFEIAVRADGADSIAARRAVVDYVGEAIAMGKR